MKKNEEFKVKVSNNMELLAKLQDILLDDKNANANLILTFVSDEIAGVFNSINLVTDNEEESDEIFDRLFTMLDNIIEYDNSIISVMIAVVLSRLTVNSDIFNNNPISAKAYVEEIIDELKEFHNII